MACTEPGSLNDKCLYTLSHWQISFSLKLLLQKPTPKIKQTNLFKIQFGGFYFLFLFCVCVFVWLGSFPIIPESTTLDRFNPDLTTGWSERTWGCRFFCIAGGDGHLILQIKPKIIYQKKNNSTKHTSRGEMEQGAHFCWRSENLCFMAILWLYCGEKERGKRWKK